MSKVLKVIYFQLLFLFQYIRLGIIKNSEISVMSSIGIMDEGYFVSRKEIYNWIRTSLEIEIHSL